MPEASVQGIQPSVPHAPSRAGFRGNVVYAFIGNVAYAGCSWVLVVLLARLGTAESVGRFSLALALTAPLALLLNLQLRSMLASDHAGRFPVNAYVRVRAGCMLLLLPVTLGLAYGLGYSGGAARVILAVGLCKAAYGASDLVHGLMQRDERMDLIAWSQVLRSVLSVAAFAVTLTLAGSLEWATAALAASWLGVFLLFDLPQGLRLTRGTPAPPLGASSTIRELCREAVPLGLCSTMMSLIVTVPRYLIESHHGEAALGYFAAVASIPFIGNMIVEALGQSAMPRLARLYASDRPAYRSFLIKLLGSVLLLGALFVLGSVFLGRVALALLYRPEYAKHASLLVLLTVVSAVIYVCSILGAALTAAGYLRGQLPAFIGIFAANAVAGVLLVPSRGMEGAAWTLGITALVWIAWLGVLVFRVAHRPPEAA